MFTGIIILILIILALISQYADNLWILVIGFGLICYACVLRKTIK